jgi:hypothetical protein
LEKGSRYFAFNFKNQRIKVLEYVKVKSRHTGIFFNIEQDKSFFFKLNQDEVKEFVKKYEGAVWDFRIKQFEEIALEEHKFQSLRFDEKKNRLVNISRVVLNVRKNWSLLKGFRGRMIFTTISDELIGVTHIDIGADVTTIIKERNTLFLRVHSINTRYGEYTIQHTIRMFLDNLLRFVKILTVSTSIIPLLVFLSQVVAIDVMNLENMIFAGITLSIPAWVLRYGRKYIIRFILNRVKQSMFEKLI